ncbi:MAG: ATP-binding protein [Pelagimonas sp.]|nr:ATP-binding protein [Pelagimonas sp.]
MTSRQWRLRTQLSMAMIFVALTALTVFIIGMLAFYVIAQTVWMNGLSEENRATLQALIDNNQVSPDALGTLVGSFSLSWGNGHADAELYSLLSLMALAVLTAVVTGILVARKISAPIEGVTAAALTIADGDLKLNMPGTEGAASEIEDLIAAFQTMADSLDQAERESTESAAAIAHELRTPLTILRGRLQGLGDGVFEPTKEMADGLIAQVDTLSQIVSELSLLSRLSSGHFSLQTLEIDLAQEVERVLAAMRPDLDRMGFEVQLSLHSVRLHADPVRVRQALAALIENVKRYGAKGRFLGIRIQTAGKFAEIQVADHGPGIPAEDRQKVFERWWHRDPDDSCSEVGTGLGLAVVKAIALAHGGTISAQAHPDQSGAIMVLRIPLNASDI